MGTETLTSLIAEVNSATANREDFTDARIITALNFSQDRIAVLKTWDELESLTTGTFVITGTLLTDKFLTMPSSTRNIYSFRVITTDDRELKLTYIPFRQFDKKIPSPEDFAAGDPEFFTIFEGKFEFWRIPDAAHTYYIRRSKWPTAFAAASPTAVSDLDRKDQAIIAGALSYLHHTLGKDEKAKEWFGIWSGLMREHTSEDTEKPDQVIMPDFEAFNNVVSHDYWVDPFIRGNP